MCTQATGDCQTTNNRQADQEEQLPDLTRLFKNRARDSDVIKKCKTMLIAGYSPQKTALLLRLPIEKVIDLYNNSYNPKCRRFANRNSFQDAKLALTMFHQGESLADICDVLGGLHLYMKWFTEFGHLNRGDMLTSEQHRCHNEKKKFQRRV
ncbi:hypothetical protein [Klebsiella quasipneumoniae]|uniref:hypothetical protein n=1 Tax=Klebsiella quasipneumoniae TaxID=1463165 RepID=UPI001E3BF745|nr:hypothetical protein [Klebsiella quasipneumoniae]